MAERSKSVLAAQAYERIMKLRAECEAEINNAPESIEQKFAARINRVRESLDDEARGLLDKLLD